MLGEHVGPDLDSFVVWVLSGLFGLCWEGLHAMVGSGGGCGVLVGGLEEEFAGVVECGGHEVLGDCFLGAQGEGLLETGFSFGVGIAFVEERYRAVETEALASGNEIF